jgi:transposase
MDKGQIGQPSNVADEERAFVAPYLALRRKDFEQRGYSLRAVLNALRYLVRTGDQYRYMPNDLPLWLVIYQRTHRWIRARCFETMVEDLRILLREFSGRKSQPKAMILDSRTLQSTPESSSRAGYDGAKRRKGSKVYAAVKARLAATMKLHTSRAKRPWSNPGDTHIPEGSPSDRSRAIYDEAVRLTRKAARIRSPSRSL